MTDSNRSYWNDTSVSLRVVELRAAGFEPAQAGRKNAVVTVGSPYTNAHRCNNRVRRLGLAQHALDVRLDALHGLIALVLARRRARRIDDVCLCAQVEIAVEYHEELLVRAGRPHAQSLLEELPQCRAALCEHLVQIRRLRRTASLGCAGFGTDVWKKIFTGLSLLWIIRTCWTPNIRKSVVWICRDDGLS